MLTRLADLLTRDAQARAAAAVAALLLGVLIGLVALIIAGVPRAAQATPPIVVAATPTTQPPRPVTGMFNYADTSTQTVLDANTISCIDGMSTAAPGMVLVVVGPCYDEYSSHVWVREIDVPPTVPVRGMADLAPQPTQAPPPPVAQQAPQVINVERPAAPEMAPVEVAPTPAPEVFAQPRDTTHERVDLTCVTDHPRPIICTPQGDWHPPMVLPDTHDAQP